MAGKSTNIEIDERINTVYKLLLEGNSRTQILQYGADAWGYAPVRSRNTSSGPVTTSAWTLSLSGPNGSMNRSVP